jgi:hypothetical protein
VLGFCIGHADYTSWEQSGHHSVEEEDDLFQCLPYKALEWVVRGRKGRPRSTLLNRESKAATRRECSPHGKWSGIAGLWFALEVLFFIGS